MITRNNVLIFSVYQANLSNKDNVINHYNVLETLEKNNIPFVELSGSYKGIPERSILVNDFAFRNIVEDLVTKFNQECYLESHGNDRSAYLVYPNGVRKAVGTLTAVDQAEAHKHDAWSYNVHTQTYWVTK